MNISATREIHIWKNLVNSQIPLLKKTEAKRIPIGYKIVIIMHYDVPNDLCWSSGVVRESSRTIKPTRNNKRQATFQAFRLNHQMAIVSHTATSRVDPHRPNADVLKKKIQRLFLGKILFSVLIPKESAIFTGDWEKSKAAIYQACVTFRSWFRTKSSIEIHAADYKVNGFVNVYGIQTTLSVK